MKDSWEKCLAGAGVSKLRSLDLVTFDGPSPPVPNCTMP